MIDRDQDGSDEDTGAERPPEQPRVSQRAAQAGKAASTRIFEPEGVTLAGTPAPGTRMGRAHRRV
jgi:hypothetical protein